jgi:hypothetical protein
LGRVKARTTRPPVRLRSETPRGYLQEQGPAGGSLGARDENGPRRAKGGGSARCCLDLAWSASALARAHAQGSFPSPINVEAARPAPSKRHCPRPATVSPTDFRNPQSYWHSYWSRTSRTARRRRTTTLCGGLSCTRNSHFKSGLPLATTTRTGHRAPSVWHSLGAIPLRCA